MRNVIKKFLHSRLLLFPPSRSARFYLFLCESHSRFVGHCLAVERRFNKRKKMIMFDVWRRRNNNKRNGWRWGGERVRRVRGDSGWILSSKRRSYSDQKFRLPHLETTSKETTKQWHKLQEKEEKTKTDFVLLDERCGERRTFMCSLSMHCQLVGLTRLI